MKATDRLIRSISYLLLVGNWAVSIYFYPRLPQEIPMHYDLRGVPDDFGAKTTIFILPGIATMIHIILSLLERLPHLLNRSNQGEKANKLKQYMIAARMLRVIRSMVLLVLLAVVVMTCLVATGKMEGLGSWFVPATVFLIAGPTIWFIIQTIRIAK